MNIESHDNTSTYIHPLICLHLYGSLCRCFCFLCSTAGSHTLCLTSHSHSPALRLFRRKVLLFNHSIYTITKKRTFIFAWVKAQLLFLSEKFTPNLHSFLKFSPSSEAFERSLISPVSSNTRTLMYLLRQSLMLTQALFISLISSHSNRLKVLYRWRTYYSKVLSL